MRILFVAALHHPDALQKAIAATPPGETPPIFPPSMGQYHWDQALRKRGHITSVFYRNIPAWGATTERHTEGLTAYRGTECSKSTRRTGAANPTEPQSGLPRPQSTVSGAGSAVQA